MDLGSGRDELQDDPFRVLRICGADDADSVGLESAGGSRNADIVRHGREPTAERPLEIGLAFGIQDVFSAGQWYICVRKYSTC